MASRRAPFQGIQRAALGVDELSDKRIGRRLDQVPQRSVLHNPAAARMLRIADARGRTLADVTRDADLVELVRQARDDMPVKRVIELYADGGLARRWPRLT